MTQNAFVERMKEEQSGDKRTVTFMGNSYDLAALGAIASGALVLASCVTCGMGLYCLPLIPLLLGLVGIVSAREALTKNANSGRGRRRRRRSDRDAVGHHRFFVWHLRCHGGAET